MAENDKKTPDDRKILPRLLWSFGRKYASREEFSRAVGQYHLDITGKNDWQPDALAFGKPEIKILLERDWEYPPDDLLELTLKSESATGFTALDLMFQLNNFAAEHDLGDHIFFEGLTYSESNNAYFINLGS